MKEFFSSSFFFWSRPRREAKRNEKLGGVRVLVLVLVLALDRWGGGIGGWWES